MNEKSDSVPDVIIFLLPFWLPSERVKAFYYLGSAEMKSWGPHLGAHRWILRIVGDIDI